MGKEVNYVIQKDCNKTMKNQLLSRSFVSKRVVSNLWMSQYYDIYEYSNLNVLSSIINSKYFEKIAKGESLSIQNYWFYIKSTSVGIQSHYL